jgi:hypothetical protein
LCHNCRLPVTLKLLQNYLHKQINTPGATVVGFVVVFDVVDVVVVDVVVIDVVVVEAVVVAASFAELVEYVEVLLDWLDPELELKIVEIAADELVVEFEDGIEWRMSEVEFEDVIEKRMSEVEFECVIELRKSKVELADGTIVPLDEVVASGLAPFWGMVPCWFEVVFIIEPFTGSSAMLVFGSLEGCAVGIEVSSLLERLSSGFSFTLFEFSDDWEISVDELSADWVLSFAFSSEGTLFLLSVENVDWAFSSASSTYTFWLVIFDFIVFR